MPAPIDHNASGTPLGDRIKRAAEFRVAKKKKTFFEGLPRPSLGVALSITALIISIDSFIHNTSYDSVKLYAVVSPLTLTFEDDKEGWGLKWNSTFSITFTNSGSDPLTVTNIFEFVSVPNYVNSSCPDDNDESFGNNLEGHSQNLIEPVALKSGETSSKTYSFSGRKNIAQTRDELTSTESRFEMYSAACIRAAIGVVDPIAGFRFRNLHTEVIEQEQYSFTPPPFPDGKTKFSQDDTNTADLYLVINSHRTSLANLWPF